MYTAQKDKCTAFENSRIKGASASLAHFTLEEVCFVPSLNSEQNASILQGVLKTQLCDSFSIRLHLKPDNKTLLHLRGYTQKLDLINASVCTYSNSMQIPRQYSNLSFIRELKRSYSHNIHCWKYTKPSLLLLSRSFPRNLCPPGPELLLLCLINIHLIECFCTFASVKTQDDGGQQNPPPARVIIGSASWPRGAVAMETLLICQGCFSLWVEISSPASNYVGFWQLERMLKWCAASPYVSSKRLL